jgi:multidrug efflux pump subunit AcrB
LTKISAFFALVVIGGRFGSLMADIPFTVIVVLAASLVECFLSHGARCKKQLARCAKLAREPWL